MLILALVPVLVLVLVLEQRSFRPSSSILFPPPQVLADCNAPKTSLSDPLPRKSRNRLWLLAVGPSNRAPVSV